MLLIGYTLLLLKPLHQAIRTDQSSSIWVVPWAVPSSDIVIQDGPNRTLILRQRFNQQYTWCINF
jgi:hypothetical protein